MENQEENIVVFSQNTDPIISEIINKYNLKETIDESKEKLKKGQLFNGGIILKVTENIILHSELKKDLPLIIKNELGVNDEIAKKLAEEIEKELAPLASIMPLKKYNELREEYSKKLVEINKEQPITAQPTRLIDENKTTPEEIATPKIPLGELKKPEAITETPTETPVEKKLPKVISAPPEIKKLNNPIQKIGASDTYREPIE